jgi:uncharacterized protein YunC (DUF1805 family)
MKAILMNGTTLAGKKYAYNDITKGIVGSGFPLDKFYGGRVTRFGKTADGLLLCLEKNQEVVIDILIDLDTLDKLSIKALKAVAAKVLEDVLANTPVKERDVKAKALEIPA